MEPAWRNKLIEHGLALPVINAIETDGCLNEQVFMRAFQHGEDIDLYMATLVEANIVAPSFSIVTFSSF